MIFCKSSFDNIESFIEHLKKNENIIGIVEYGGRTYTDMSIGGLWKEDETLFHLLPEGKNDEYEQNRLFNILMNE